MDLGRAVLADQVFPDVKVQVPTSSLNRHGLIAGATGTGKTRSLQLMAEQLSELGIPAFAADMKGDLGGLMREGEEQPKVKERVQELSIEWSPTAYPIAFFSLGGVGPGIPLRATVSSFGPQLMAKVLEANDVQGSSLGLVFHYADQSGLPLVDLSDLRSLLQFLTSDEGKAELKGLGGLSTSTAGVLLRKLIELEQQGAEAFFGEPQVEVSDLLATSGGKGVISCLELPAIQDRPRIFSTFLMWLLADLFHELPEVGDVQKPKLVFFFDEAHFLFEGATKAFLAEVTQTVRLIRSKGVGIFFITQLPDDVPDDILAQLGNRVQHALRTFTPRDAKALKATVTTFPKTDDYDLEEELTRLGIGEAMVTVLDGRGVPTPVVWTRMLPPRSSMNALDAGDVDQAAKASPLWPKLAAEVNRESAEEKLAARIKAAQDASVDVVVPPPPPQKRKGGRVREPAERPTRGRRRKGYLETQEGRRTVNIVLRGVLGLLKRRR